MAQLLNMTVQSPGFLGLNKQSSGSVLPVGWATKALNLVIDEVGRMAKRNGTKRKSTDAVTGGEDIEVIHTYVDISGNELLIGASDNAIWKLVAGAWTDISGTITTPSADDWKFQNFNGKCVGWQSGHTPIVLASVAGSFADITASSGTLPAGVDVLAAYGRLWVLDGSTLYYSDLLDETGWAAGTAGSTTLTRVWPGGADTPVALAEFNGHLIVFGETKTLVWGGPTDPSSAFSTFELIESIDGVGCLNKRTIANVGRDLLWLSNDGLKTLGRVIQEKSMPTTDAAPHVRDYLLSLTAQNDATTKAAYSQLHGLYVMTTSATTLVFDLRGRLPDGSFRVTEWDSGFKCPATTTAGGLLMGKGGHIVSYEGRMDNVTLVGGGGDNIVIDFEGVWNDFGEEVQTLLKFLKRVKLYVYGAAGETISFKWAIDYEDQFRSANITIPTGQTIARWGVAQYTLSYYSGGFSFSELSKNTSKSGRVVKMGIRASLGNSPFAISRIDLFAKVGKMAL